MINIVDKFLSILNGELLLRFHPNGGTVIMLRSLWITFMSAFMISIFSSNDWKQPFQPSSLKEYIAWIAVIFAFSYTALYARFAAQWQYLASLYNQIKQVEITAHAENREHLKNSEQQNEKFLELIIEWKVGFIEDAEVLHLAEKSNFATIIHHWTKEPGKYDSELKTIKKIYIETVAGGEARYDNLIRKVKKAYHEHTAKAYS